MHYLVSTALLQYVGNRVGWQLGSQANDLLLVMGVDECFDGLDRRVNPLGTDQRRQRDDEPASSAPGPMQPRELGLAQELLQGQQMLALSGKGYFRESSQGGV